MRARTRRVGFEQLLDSAGELRIQQDHVWFHADGDPQAAVGAVGHVDHVSLASQLDRDAVGQRRGGAANHNQGNVAQRHLDYAAFAVSIGVAGCDVAIVRRRQVMHSSTAARFA